ncbi:MULTISPECIES: hypothetical protein [Streptomyces]|uniref:hypothetical protein n=1 Tax=Streptomyces TaxID=1883 RepID=UPI001EE65209|nr:MULTISPECIES: hypothetical protein [Streptomyces]
MTTRTHPHTASADTSHFFVTDAIMNGLPPYIAQVICGHRSVDTTIGYKAVYPAETFEAVQRARLADIRDNLLAVIPAFHKHAGLDEKFRESINANDFARQRERVDSCRDDRPVNSSPQRWARAEWLDAERMIEALYSQTGVRLTVQGPCPGGQVGRWVPPTCSGPTAAGRS